MKTKEFIKRVIESGFTISYYVNPCSNATKPTFGFHALIISDNEDDLVTVWTESQYAISTIVDGFCAYKINEPLDELYKLCFEYASTPVSEREEEKKYYLKHRYFRFYNGSSKYLGMDLLKDKPDLYSKIAYEWVKNQFTLKEIEEIKKKFDTDLADFEIVEVEDED